MNWEKSDTDMKKEDVSILYVDAKAVAQTDLSSGDVIVSDNLSPQEILDVIMNKGVFHVVQKSATGYENTIRCAIRIVQDDHQFILHPLSVIAGEDAPTAESEINYSIFSKELADSGQKHDLIEELLESVKAHSNSKGLLSDIRLIADEMITNAIYNAPFVHRPDVGVGQQGHKVMIDPQKKPRIFLGVDDRQFVVGCTDMYGSLDISKLTKRIYRGFASGTNSIINFGAGGAGLGTYLIFNLCSTYYVAVAPGKMTTVCCGIPRKMSATKRAAEPKNLSMFEIKE